MGNSLFLPEIPIIMKNLYAFLLMLSPIVATAQLDTKYCGQFATAEEDVTMDIIPLEGESNSCFYIMYYNGSNVGEDEVGEMYSGSGSCKKSSNRYTVNLDGSENKLFLEFTEGSTLSVQLYDGKTRIATLEQHLNYDELLEQYRLEEELMNSETEGYDVEYEEDSYDTDGTTEEYTSPSVYSNEKGWAISMLMYSATEGYFAAVSITEGGACELNSLEGTIHPGKEQGLYIAETVGGCVFAEIRVNGNSVTLIEKKCKDLDRGNCPSLSGTYKASED